MKINGENLGHPNVEVVVFPRSGGKDLVFKFQSVLDTTEFEKQFPAPQPPMITKKGDIVGTPDFTDKDYRKKAQEWGAKRLKWMFLKSIEATPNLEWEKIKLNDSDTWELLEQELQESGLNKIEVMHMYAAMMKANSLDEDYLAEARQRFFDSQKEKKELEEK